LQPTTAHYTLSLHDALPIYDEEQVLPFAGAPVVPVAPQEIGPDPRLGRVLAVAALDLLLGGPFDVARDDQSLAVGQPHGKGLVEIGRAQRLNSSHVATSYAV